MSRKLYVIGQGIGNVIETVYTFQKLREFYDNGIDVCYNHRTKIDGSIDKALFYQPLADYYGFNLVIAFDDILFECDGDDYDGQILSCWVNPIRNVDIIARPESAWVNEVDRNNDVLWQVGVQYDMDEGMNDFRVDWQKIREKTSKNPTSKYKYDVIINNGAYNTLKWHRKRYRHWDRVSCALGKRWHVGAVGHSNEIPGGADDLSSLSLLETMDVVANCRLFLGNDSGLYHFAAAVGTMAIVMFTATNIKKNYNENFHKSVKILCTDLKCQPCQVETWGWSPAFSRCQDYRCCDYSSESFVRIAEMMLADDGQD